MSDAPQRHWHGQPGDRHEHLNVWVQGGPKGPSQRAAWALTPEMIAATTRRSSDASTSSNNAATNTAGQDPPYMPTLSERRRSSTSSGGPLFSHLQTQKRESGDAAAATRRQSYSDQTAKGGVFSKLWDGYTRGK